MRTIKNIAKLLTVSLLLGIIGGTVGAAFSFLISLMTDIRTNNSRLIYFLPVAGVLIVFLYQKLGIYGVGTNDVLKSADGDKKLSPLLCVGVFISTVISHLFGASVGREGAALQIGGSLSSLFSKAFNLNENQRKILVQAGMAAVFSGVFGTPLAAFFFALEVIIVGNIRLKSVAPCFIASVSAFFASHFLGAHHRKFSLGFIPDFSFNIAWKIAIITVLTAILSVAFCLALKYSEKFAKKFFKNPYFRIITGGVVVILMTVIVGNNDYNGAGVSVIERIFNTPTGQNSLGFNPAAFLLKLVFTCVSVSAGYKGGEIVPTLFIGATFGALLSAILGVPLVFGAALGMILLFCGVTNCPLASVFLALELFLGAGFWYFIPTVFICFLLSGKSSLYSAQKTSSFLNFRSIKTPQNSI